MLRHGWFVVWLALTTLIMIALGVMFSLIIHALPSGIIFVLAGAICGALAGGWAASKAAKQLYVFGNPEWPFVRVKDPERLARRAAYRADPRWQFLTFAPFALLFVVGLFFLSSNYGALATHAPNVLSSTSVNSGPSR